MNRALRARHSLSLRLQPYEGDLMAEVASYLNGLPKDERNRKVADILVAALLPLARYKSGNYTHEKLRFACWESQDCLNKHGSNMRLALGVEQPQFMHNDYTGRVDNYRSDVVKSNKESPEVETVDKTVEDNKDWQVSGEASSDDLDNVFGD
ncbi:MAG: hypothetical protein AAF316_12645 [Cyanobacteria bacterium P01_A01_bin.80]